MVTKKSKTFVLGCWFEKVDNSSYKLSGAASVKTKITAIIRLDTACNNFYVLPKHSLSKQFYSLAPSIVSLLDSEVDSYY